MDNKEKQEGVSRTKDCPLKLSIRYLTNRYEASYMRWPLNEPKKYVGEQIIKVMLSEEEIETVRMKMFGAKIEPAKMKFYDRIEAEVKAKLDETLGMDCDSQGIEYQWAPGEQERLTAGLRYLNEDDVRLMKSRVKEKGNVISSEELFRGLENCFIWKEEWTRETGHLWNKYTLLKREPSKDEYDYADTWSFSPERLTSFSKEFIIKMLNENKE